MKKTLLITGATGFIGKHLLECLEKNYADKYDIVLLSSTSHDVFKTVLHNDYTFTKDDFHQIGIIHINIVLHIGAFIPKSGPEANNIKESNSNISNTKYLLDHLPNIPSKFIFLSTIDVYGAMDTIIDEYKQPTPLTMYGWSKLYCEKMIESWALDNKVVIQLLRVGHIYGKGEEAYKKVIPVNLQRIKNGENPQIFGSGKEKRSFLHVDDVCNLIIKSLDLERYEGVINLCSNKSYTIKEIIELLLKITNSNLKIEYKQSHLQGIDYVFDTSKMNQLLGYEQVSIEDGLKDEYN
ncbi:NAD-dependent epimerase/dehydratase family protein [Sulfurospirillum sp.]|uniref:NAD-dependent epimerase/dehydratase family protein n=1 Tax=Sulfurospirillum sp. TaxID=2053622 RepID=UPI002FDE80AD